MRYSHLSAAQERMSPNALRHKQLRCVRFNVGLLSSWFVNVKGLNELLKYLL